MKKHNEQNAGAERILGRKLARELRGQDLARVNGSYYAPGGSVPLEPITTTTLISPPDSRADGYVG